MNFGRLPFQFSATNPVERQSELMRRFGLSSDDDKMLLENHLSDGLSHSSPRLQHRLPDYLAGSHPVKVIRQGGAENVDSEQREPRVRVVPIKIEGDSGSERTVRQRTQSGGATIPISPSDCNKNDDHVRQRTNSGSFIPTFKSNLKSDFPAGQSYFSPSAESRQTPDTVSSPGSRARVCNIPIVVEGKGNKKNSTQCRSVPIQRELSEQNKTNMGNGPCVSKSATEPLHVSKVKKENKKPDFNVPLKQIEAILKEFEAYKEGVDKFTGVQGDKQYRYLDEMLTRCMLKLDDIETLGNEEVRKARKNAVTQVQDAINVLDSKVQPKQREQETPSAETNMEENAVNGICQDELNKEESSEEILNSQDQHTLEGEQLEAGDKITSEPDVRKETGDVMEIDQNVIQVNEVTETRESTASAEESADKAVEKSEAIINDTEYKAEKNKVSESSPTIELSDEVEKVDFDAEKYQARDLLETSAMDSQSDIMKNNTGDDSANSNENGMTSVNEIAEKNDMDVDPKHIVNMNNEALDAASTGQKTCDVEINESDVCESTVSAKETAMELDETEH